MVSPIDPISSSPSALHSPYTNYNNDSLGSIPSQEQLDSICVEIISNKFTSLGVGKNASLDMAKVYLDDSATAKNYKKNQLRFLDWAAKNSISFTTFTNADLVNFLTYLKQTSNLQVNTLKSIRAAVIHLHINPTSLSTDPLVNAYIQSLQKQVPPILIHRPKVDLTPSIRFARSIKSNHETSIRSLQ